uniref:Translin-associated factor X-interacting protein 1 N-terminal domain-containing protein n=1 Tax=Amphiprion percula TaxID=161767 RepID=A0A3P8TDF8_AMPPE
MSNSCKPNSQNYGSDIHRLLLAAEAGQKADILCYSSGHLGPRSLDQPHRETKQFFWRSLEETPLTLQQKQIKSLPGVKKREKKQPLSEVTAVKSGLLRSRQYQAAECSSHADRREDIKPPEILYPSLEPSPIQLRACSQKKSSSESDPEQNHLFCSSHLDKEVLNKKDQLEMKQQFRKQVLPKQDLWAGTDVAEMHERKLQKELSKLSAQSRPSRERLAVFSDVFDDVCEGSPVFGRILREIKVFPFPLYPLQDSGPDIVCTDSILFRRLEVLNTWEEIQQLEEEIKEKLVPTATTAVTEGCIKDQKVVEGSAS